jgi:signal transduction histidine kinase
VQLFWSPLAINFFIELLMVSLLTGYFAVRLANELRTQVNVKIAFFLLLTFASASCGTLLQFLGIALHPDYAEFALPFVSVFGALAMSGFLLFAFYFQRQSSPKWWVEATMLVSICLIIGIESFVAIQRIVLLSQGIVEYRDHWLSIPFPLGFFAVHAILLFRVVDALAQEQHRRRHQAVWLAIQALLIPSIRLEQQAAALRAFFYVTVLPAAIGIVLIVRGFGWIDWSLAELLNCWLTLLTYVGFTLFYINHTPEYSSFQFKLVGITLAVVLSILSGMSWVIASAFPDADLDRVYQSVAAFILVATLAILLIFPRFFHVSLNRPLQAMIRGVRDIQAGNLSATIPVLYHDEIGFLTQSFNDMAAVQHDLVLHLEERVAERTAEVASYAAENARLEERNHLSRELHDAVSQTLFSASLMADTLPLVWQQNPQQGQQVLAELRELNQNALAEMRILLLELRPSALIDKPFGELLRQLSSSVEAHTRLTIRLDIEQDCVLPPQVQTTFYRIAQESLNNISKHAKATLVSLYFEGITVQAILTISDDGCGFHPQQVQAGHLGLDIMRERATAIGASLEIEAQPQHGTTITLIWNQADAG